jgi:hypothetical protein
VLSSVVPGLRELRAPLAAGYLWLLIGWLMVGDQLPTAGERKPPAIERLYRAEPVLSRLGLAVAASVAAYVLGSVLLDLQTRIASRVRSRWARIWQEKPTDYPEQERLILLPVLAGLGVFTMLNALLPAGDLLDYTLACIAGLFVAYNLYWTRKTEWWFGPWQNTLGHPHAVRELRGTAQGRSELGRWLSELVDEPLRPRAAQSAWWFIDENRNVIKTRLLAISEPLHAEVDRPEAEATFRMALTPPLAVLAAYLSLAVSWWWLLTFAVPALLAWQWMSMRRRADDALVTAVVTHPDLSEPVADYVIKDAIATKADEAVGREQGEHDNAVVRVRRAPSDDDDHWAELRAGKGRVFDVWLDHDLKATRVEAREQEAHQA